MNFVQFADDLVKLSRENSLKTPEAAVKSSEKAMQPRPKLPTEHCSECKNRRLRLSEGENGRIMAKFCSCVEERGNWEEKEALQETADDLHRAEIPNRYLAARDPKGIHPEILSWIEKYKAQQEVPSTLFLYGGVGAGKTHSAIHALLSVFPETTSFLYLPTYKFLELRNEYLDHRFSDDKEEKSRSAKVYRNYHRFLKTCDFLVLDELGQEKLAPDESKVLFQLLDTRYSSGKVTICISNHSDDRKRSLDGKLLTSLVGARIASRLKSAQQVYFTGPDLRVHEGSEVISKEEIDNFMVPAKILTHSDDTHHIMNWLARNPAFEVVSTQKRKELTYIDQKGQERDKDRPIESFARDVWINGDCLQITGPVCDHEDKKIYAFLVKELVKRHKDGWKGLFVELSYSYILRMLGSDDGGKNISILKRQLDRLNRMTLVFTNVKGNKWSGPLLTSLYQKGEGKEQKVVVEFNRYMIIFYRLNEYTTFNKQAFQKFKGDSSAFYLFYSSHSEKDMTVSVEKCKKLLAIPDGFDKKEALKRVKKAVQHLVDAKVMDPIKTFVKNGKVHTSLANV